MDWFERIFVPIASWLMVACLAILCGLLMIEMGKILGLLEVLAMK